MRIFVSEYVCGGAWRDGQPEDSLLREGRSMLAAIVADFARIVNCSVVTTCDARLAHPGWLGPDRMHARVDVKYVSGPDQERRLFRQLAAESDATFAIAPEFDGILLDRRQLVDKSGGRFLGPSAEAISLCTDKLRLAAHLQRHGVATIPTRPLRADAEAAFPFPVVVKPRDGAGSQRTFLVRGAAELAHAQTEFVEASGAGEPLCQPYVPGRPLSVAAIIAPGQERIDIFPVGEQLLSDDGRFQYLGGRIPARITAGDSERIDELVRRAVQSIPGLKGYVGIDLILPDSLPAEPLIVEINPRLTTSYLGYRELACDNIAERILRRQEPGASITWKTSGISFTTAGRPDFGDTHSDG